MSTEEMNVGCCKEEERLPSRNEQHGEDLDVVNDLVEDHDHIFRDQKIFGTSNSDLRLKDPVSVGPVKRICPHGCGKLIAQRTVDYHRTNGCRMSDDFGEVNRNRSFTCGVCYDEFPTRATFFNHVREEHDVQADIHNTFFDSRAAFDRFVRWLEMEGGAHFRHKSGSKKRPTGQGIFMICNRSGVVERRVDPEKKREDVMRSGPFRTGYTCTGFIHGAVRRDGTVSVEFCGDHYGHDARMRLPNIIKYLIAQKQMDGESNGEILLYLRKHFEPFSQENIYAQRICLVDLEELRTLQAQTKKYGDAVPIDCEIWEEELLDRAGIERQGVPRIRQFNEKTTQEIAEEDLWPQPRIFVSKIKDQAGNFVPVGDYMPPNIRQQFLRGDDMSILDGGTLLNFPNRQLPDGTFDMVPGETGLTDGEDNGRASFERAIVVEDILSEMQEAYCLFKEECHMLPTKDLQTVLQKTRGLNATLQKTVKIAKSNEDNLRQDAVDDIDLNNKRARKNTRLETYEDRLSDDEDMLRGTMGFIAYNSTLWS